jgi:hypothetical protein
MMPTCTTIQTSTTAPAIKALARAMPERANTEHTPVGRLRLLCPRLAKYVVAPKLGQFVRDYRTLNSTSRPMMVGSIWRLKATMRGFSSESTSRTIW